ncbi:MAG: division/cell wall cluster transcriptional repressor MraZ [Pseudomonadota bacterium]
MSAFEGYSGYAYSPSGDKGRFALPPTLRKEVRDSSDDNAILCLAAHEDMDCLVGFGLSRIPKLHAQLEREEERAIRLGQTDFNPEIRGQQLFGFERLPFDASGRFVMPEYLRDLGQVDSGLFFQGAGDFFFIWNPDVLATMGSGFKVARAACVKLVAEAQAKAAKKGGSK